MSFDPPNYTKVPNKLFWLIPQMGQAELKVTLVIVRDTFGWNADGAATTRSLTELMALTGLSRQGVLDGLNAGQERGTLYKIDGQGNKSAYGLVVNEVDRSTELTGLPSRPELVNLVDQPGQVSRPQVVNSVDRSNTARPAPRAGKSKAERKLKQIEGKEGNAAAAAAGKPGQEEGSEQLNPTGASGTTAPTGAGQANAQTVTGSAQPPAGLNASATSSEKVPGAGPLGSAGLAVIAGALRGMKTPLPELMAEREYRAEWVNLPADDVRRLEAAARKDKGTRYRSAFIAALDEAALLRLAPAPEPTPPSSDVDDLTALLDSAPLDGNRRRS